MSSVYESCSAESGGNLELVVECVANWVESSRNGGNGGNGTTDGSSSPTATATKTYVDTDELKSWLLVLTGALVFFMQVCANLNFCECMGNDTIYSIARK